MCFAIGSQHLGCCVSHPKHVSNPDSVIKKVKPHLMYRTSNATDCRTGSPIPIEFAIYFALVAPFFMPWHVNYTL